MNTNGYKVFNHVRGTPEALDNLVRIVLEKNYENLIYEMGNGYTIKLTDGNLMIESFARKSDACYQFIKHFHEHEITHVVWVNRKWFDDHLNTIKTLEGL